MSSYFNLDIMQDYPGSLLGNFGIDEGLHEALAYKLAVVHFQMPITQLLGFYLPIIFCSRPSCSMFHKHEIFQSPSANVKHIL